MNFKLPPPLTTAQFYILLALAREEQHGYGIIGTVNNHSLETLKLNGGKLYPLLSKIMYAGLITATKSRAVGRSLIPRRHYGITAEGRYRLKCDLKRLRHAVRVGEAAGLFNDELPPDIQRLLEQLA
jgi:PadR family transcriptional regulator, regulatory protein PadR